MSEIHFLVRGVPDAFKQRRRLRDWLRHVADDHGAQIESLGLVLMTARELLQINRRYLGHDEHTDVITFAMEEGLPVQGEILMSHPRIKENALDLGVPLQTELRRVMVHGLLHLLGHTDASTTEREAMRSREDHYLDRWSMFN